MTEPARGCDAAASFDPLRPKLMRVAYRMLGSVADAEDVVQEAFIRWMGADRAEVREPEAFLRRTVTRLCLDQLKSARHQRETYIGPWLPEPVVEEEGGGGRHPAADAGAGAAVAAGARGVPAARRVRPRLRGGRGDDRARCRRLPPARRAGARPCARGAAALQGREAARAGARRGLLRRLAQRRHDGACARCSRPTSACTPMAAASGRPSRGRSSGCEAVLQAARGPGASCSRNHPSKLVHVGLINGLPGFVTREADGELQTTALEIEDGRIAAIYVVRNPDKLRHLH